MSRPILPSFAHKLSLAEQDELRNVMLNEPVFAGNTISHQTAKSLRDKGLIYRDENGEWCANWRAIKAQKDK